MFKFWEFQNMCIMCIPGSVYIFMRWLILVLEIEINILSFTILNMSEIMFKIVTSFDVTLYQLCSQQQKSLNS